MKKETLRQEEAFERLEPFHREAKAGAPDHFLSSQAGVTLSMVRRWRRKHGYYHNTGKARAEEIRRFAMDLLGRPDREDHPLDVLLRAEASPIDGRWEPPEFVVRGAVNYPMMLEQIYYLHRRGGFSPEDIAKAHGYTDRTVRQAIALVERNQKEEE